jgi:hypothetical protein
MKQPKYYILGAVVDEWEAKVFAQKCHPYDTAEVIASFIKSVINGDVKVNLREADSE